MLENSHRLSCTVDNHAARLASPTIPQHITDGIHDFPSAVFGGAGINRSKIAHSLSFKSLA
jgi:hypothetical protein